MIVVAIIGILAAIALPNYNDYVTRSRITRATSGLADFRVRMEQYFQDNRNYPGACISPPVALLVGQIASPPNTAEFLFTCAGLSPTAYILTATGAGSMAGFIYTVDQTNLKATTTPVGWTNPGNCWVTSKGGC